ncbi:MAG: translocation/assembly module TamB domain-containing protein [Planctomycetes bacterium]|nr:translocation/assembly module TamB domain-containing protein [Planctomycetota bacterium]
MSPPPAPAARSPRPPRLRRWRRWLLLAGATVAALLAGVWTFRQQLVVPWLRPRLERALAELLAAERVTLGEIGGDWLGQLDLHAVDIEAAPPPLRQVRGARLTARYALWPLLHGDPAGLRWLQVEADSIELDLRHDPAATAPADRVSSADGADYGPWLRALPEGASVRVARLQLRGDGGERTQPLALTVAGGQGRRQARLSFGDLQLAATLAAPGAADGALPIRLELMAPEPGAQLALFGVDTGVHGGRLAADIGLSLDPLRIEGDLELRDLRRGSDRLAQSQVRLQLDDQRLAIDRADVDLPGIALRLQGLSLPSPFGAAGFAAAAVTGQFEARIDDLSAYAGLLPETVQELLPARGQVKGRASDGRLQLDRSVLAVRGAEVTIEGGSVPFTGDWRTTAGSLRATVAFDGDTCHLPWFGPTALAGRIAGEVAGSLVEPRVDLRLELGRCRSARGGFAATRGVVRADPDAIAVEGLVVQDLEAAGLPAGAAATLTLAAAARRRDGGLDPDSLALSLTIDSPAAADLLAPAFAAAGLGPGPGGAASLQLQVRHDATGVHLDALRLRTGPDAGLAVELDGRGTLPLRWPGSGELMPLAAGAAEFELHAHRPEGPATPPLRLAATARVAPTSFTFDLAEGSFGALRLRGALHGGAGAAAVLAGSTDLLAVPLQASFELEPVDLATLPAEWFGGTPARGRATARARATGTLAALAPELALELDDAEFGGTSGAPWLGRAMARCTVGTGPGGIVAQVEAQAMLDRQFGHERDLSLSARLVCDDDGTRLQPAWLRVAGGELALTLDADLRRGDLLRGAVDPGRIRLAGGLRLHGFQLERLPARWIGAESWRGRVTGEVALDGRLGAGPVAAVRTAELSLQDGELKLEDLPRIERLAATVRGDRMQIVLEPVVGALGAGQFTARGTLRAGQAPIDEDLDAAELALALQGEDLLLYRSDGAKVRAGIDVTAAGPLRAIAVRGHVEAGRGTKYVRRISLLPSLGAQGGAAVTEGLQVAPLPRAFGDRIDLDVAVRTREPFEVRTHVVDGDIDIAARLRGSGSAPRLEGTMAMRGGQLRFPGANLTIDSGLLTFTPGAPRFPELSVHATGRRMGIVVTMSITGRYDQPVVQVSSVPTLPPQDLIVLLTTGQLPSTLAAQGVTGQARFVGGYLAKEVFERYFGSESTERGESLFDRLTIETGREVSQSGTESVLVEYLLVPRLSIRLERDAYEDYNMGVVLRFRFP